MSQKVGEPVVQQFEIYRERTHLADGLVMGDIIECPKHNGRFNYKTGRARGAPVCVDLATYPVRVMDGRVQVQIEGT